MDPISSSVSTRANSLQAPLPAQQKRDEEAITAPQPPADSASTSFAGRDVQLQRRQVVEEVGKNQSAQAELRSAGDQLRQGVALAEAAAEPSRSDNERRQLQDAFAEVSNNLSALADKADKSGNNAIDTNSLRVRSGIESRSAAKETADSLSQSLDQVQSGLATLASQEQNLNRDFPRTVSNDDNRVSISSRQQADQIARQTQNRIQQDSGNALAAQANTDKQTALTLFQ